MEEGIEFRIKKILWYECMKQTNFNQVTNMKRHLLIRVYLT